MLGIVHKIRTKFLEVFSTQNPIFFVCSVTKCNPRSLKKNLIKTIKINLNLFSLQFFFLFASLFPLKLIYRNCLIFLSKLHTFLGEGGTKLVTKPYIAWHICRLCDMNRRRGPFRRTIPQKIHKNSHIIQNLDIIGTVFRKLTTNPHKKNSPHLKTFPNLTVFFPLAHTQQEEDRKINLMIFFNQEQKKSIP